MLTLPASNTELRSRTSRARSINLFPPIDHELTVLVPACNETARLGPTLAQLESYLERTAIDYRILVVDDGSQDETANFTDGRGSRLATLRLGTHRGKGAAVRAGMLAATGAIVAFTDADLPYDLRSLVKGYELIRQGSCEVVLGARDLNGSTNRASRRLSRRVATKLFRYVASTFISRDVTDTQCGLKLFSRPAALNIFSRATIDGFAFDAEVVHLVHRLEIDYRRIPVSLINEYASTLSLSRHAVPMLMDVCKVWYRHRKSTTGMSLPAMLASPQSTYRQTA
jgi:dolichyl-phosphate beta-glucosyltransferase